MRHYEIAANGCVPCFRALQEKPPTCAPHGLDKTNCIIYNGLPDLLHQIEDIDEDRYRQLQYSALDWARHNVTTVRALELLAASGHGVDPTSIGNKRACEQNLLPTDSFRQT
jgi:hypothetical protein